MGRGQQVDRLRMGHLSAREVRDAIAEERKAANGLRRVELVQRDWFPQLRQRLQAYTRGERVDFLDCKVGVPARTAFQRRVIDGTRKIPYGQTVTYSELAARAGSPGAARAVGNVMAANTVPIIIPCHRVVAAGGRLGGFSAPQGVSLKERMLAMEAEHAER